MNEVALVVFSFITFGGYILTNRLPYKLSLKCTLDQRIKVVAWFVIPYVLLYPYIVATYLILGTTHQFPMFLTTLIFCNILATLFWFLVPNGVKRIPVASTDLLSRLLNWIYKSDGDANGFPSGHVYLSIICSYCLIMAFGNLTVLWVLLGIVISLSTILTKQHYILDVPGGMLFAGISILITNRFIL